MRIAPLVLVAALLAVPASAAPARPSPGERALATVRLIASFGPRPAGGPGAERRVAKLVTARLRALGYRVVVQPFPIPRGGVSQNVVGLTSPRPRVLLVAHLDGVRRTAAANDNGSGVAVLLELARALRGREGVLVVATGAEERVVTGSRVHLGAQRLLRGISSEGKRRIRLALALDMVGVGERLYARGIEARPNRPARLVLARGRLAYLPDRGESDHAELSRAGVPAAWLQWRPDPCWHSPCDVASRVSADRLETAYRIALASATAALDSAR